MPSFICHFFVKVKYCRKRWACALKVSIQLHRVGRLWLIGETVPLCDSPVPSAQVLTPLQGGLPQQTGVIIQPPQIVLASGNKVPGNTQVSISSSLAFTLVIQGVPKKFGCRIKSNFRSSSQSCARGHRVGDPAIVFIDYLFFTAIHSTS